MPTEGPREDCMQLFQTAAQASCSETAGPGAEIQRHFDRDNFGEREGPGSLQDKSYFQKKNALRAHCCTLQKKN